MRGPAVAAARLMLLIHCFPSWATIRCGMSIIHPMRHLEYSIRLRREGAPPTVSYNLTTRDWLNGPGPS